VESATYSPEETHVLRLTHDEDLLGQLTDYCNEHRIDAAEITVIGAVRDASLGFYDQETQEYEQHHVDKPMEIIQATGNLSYNDGERFVHLHATLSDEDGTIHAGHVFEGTTVFAGESMIHELDGPGLRRFYDENTGLSLWEFVN